MRKYFLPLFCLMGFSFLFYFCSSDTEGDKIPDTGVDSGLRFCKNSAQCKLDEECSGNVCVPRSPKDAETDTISDITDIQIEDTSDTLTDISDLQDVEDISDITDTDIPEGYISGISSVYEGSAGECANNEYTIRSVSGYSGWNIIKNNEYTINAQARFK